MKETWFEFNAYISPTIYGFGTAAEAHHYADYVLNKSPDTHRYSCHELSDERVFALCLKNRHESFKISDKLVPRAEGIPLPLCVWCSTPWTEDMIKVSAEAEMNFDSYPQMDPTIDHVNVNIDITCSSCHRLVYRKEIRHLDNGL